MFFSNFPALSQDLNLMIIYYGDLYMYTFFPSMFFRNFLSIFNKSFCRFVLIFLAIFRYLMGGIEKTIETFKDTLLAKTGGILKAFFDHDILDEEVIIEWGKKVRNITFLFVFMTGLNTSLEI